MTLFTINDIILPRMGFYMNNKGDKKEIINREMYKMIFTTKEGQDIEYEIILTFKNHTNKKIYYIMTDNTRTENNELNITPFYVNYDDNKLNEDNTFYPVLDDNELSMVFDVFNKIKNDL